MSQKEYLILILSLVLSLPTLTTALTQVNITNPNENTTETGTINLNATTDATANNVTFTIHNTTTTINTTTNTTTGTNFTIQYNTSQTADGTYTINATASNATNTVTTQITNVSFDNTAPSIHTIQVEEQDTFYSYHANDSINLQVNTTDNGPAGIQTVQADFSRFPGITDTKTLTFNTTTGYYEINYTPDTNTFNTSVIPVTATDAVTQSSSDTTFTTTLHNLTTPRGPSANPCFRFGQGTTNFSQESNFANVNFIMHAELNGTQGCMPGQNRTKLPPWTGFNRIGTLNFSSLDFTNPNTSSKLAGIGQNINVNPKLPGNFGNSRIFVNTTYLASLDTNSTLTLYDLPFRSKPAIIGDNTSKLASTTWSQGGYNANFGAIIGNLTFDVTGFSEYNATDTTNPAITPNTPVRGENITADFTYNVTLNGTGTAISNKTLTIDTTEYNLTCNNVTQGSDTQHCTTTANLTAGDHTVNVTAWDYGNASPGNTNTTIYNFTVVGQVTGNATDIKGMNNAAVRVDSSTNLAQTFTGDKTVNITTNGKTSVYYTQDFDTTNLNLSSINITETTLNNDNTITVTGVTAATKTVYMNDTANKNGVCIRDASDTDASSITNDCTGIDETSLKCTTDGTTTNQYTCTDLGSRLKIENLTHSAVTQYDITSSSSTTTGGGGGGGGGIALQGSSYDELTAGEEKNIIINNDAVPINVIELTPLTNLTDVTIDISRTARTAPGTIISEFNAITNFPSEDVTGITFNFILRDNELDNLTPETITLYRKSTNGWNALPTEYAHTYQGHEYTAETPSFSRFALGHIPNEHNETQNTTTETTNRTDDANINTTTTETITDEDTTRQNKPDKPNTNTRQNTSETTDNATEETPKTITQENDGPSTLLITTLGLLIALASIYLIYTYNVHHDH